MNKQMAKQQMAAIQKALAVMAKPGQVIEVRIVGVDGRKGRVDSGYFDNFEQLARAIPSYTRRAEGIYITLNPVNPALLARAANRIKPWSNLTTTDTDIIYRQWLPIDIDPVRPAGISSTHEEHEATQEKALAIGDALASYGWPSPVYADSGNGAHLLYRVDLPNTLESAQLLQHCLQALATQHNDDSVKIDSGNYNAGRIWKLYYTLTAKGDSTKERPHRWSRIISADSPMGVVSETQLQQLAVMAPAQPLSEEPKASSAFDIDAWLQRHGLNAYKSAWKGGWRWKLERCPFSNAHNDGAYIVQFANGAISAGCHHNSCQSKTWRDLRTLYESPEQTPPLRKPDLDLQHLLRTELSVAFSGFLQELKDELRTANPSAIAQP
jgi:hypothetical protein